MEGEMEHVDQNMQCEGNCIKKYGRHSGDVKRVKIPGWGEFFYCDNAIQEDISREFVVDVEDYQPAQAHDWAGNGGTMKDRIINRYKDNILAYKQLRCDWEKQYQANKVMQFNGAVQAHEMLPVISEKIKRMNAAINIYEQAIKDIETLSDIKEPAPEN